MKLAVIYDKEALKREGDESTIYCSICNSEIRIGIYRTLFCSKCEIVGGTGVKIDSVLSCIHCEQPLVAKKNYDGRITARCENPACGDCWSMQDLCLIKMDKCITSESGEDPYITHINNINEAEIISNAWVDVKTLGFCELKQEIYEYFLKTNPHLVKANASKTLMNVALASAIELNYQRLKNMDTRKNKWHSISSLIRESGAKRELVVSVVEKFKQEACPYEIKFYTKQGVRARFVHSEIYAWIMEQIKNRKS
ncbi:MAG: hypothetical protein WCN88_02985 [Candidatus Falkowbacteria bacterium]